MHLQAKVVLYGEQQPSTPIGGLRFVTSVSDKMSEIKRIPPYGSEVNFLVTGLFLLSLPTVAKGFVSLFRCQLFDLCFARCRSINESPNLPQEGPSCHRLGNHKLLYPLFFATFAQVMM